MMENTYNRFMIRRAEGRRKTVVDSDDDYFNEKNSLFGRISGEPRSGIALHITTTKNGSKKRDGIETQYLLQGE